MVTPLKPAIGRTDLTGEDLERQDYCACMRLSHSLSMTISVRIYSLIFQWLVELFRSMLRSNQAQGWVTHDP
jgi:hypothetical protein